MLQTCRRVLESLKKASPRSCMEYCKACRKRIPANLTQRTQHCRGKKHLAMAYYGQPNHKVQKHLQTYNRRAFTTTRSHDVPNWATDAARRIRSFVKKTIYLFTGQDHMQTLWSAITPEKLVAAFVSFNFTIRRNTTHADELEWVRIPPLQDGHLHPIGILCLAENLTRQPLLRETHLRLRAWNCANDLVHQQLMSIALDAFVASIGKCPNLKVSLYLDDIDMHPIRAKPFLLRLRDTVSSYTCARICIFYARNLPTRNPRMFFDHMKDICDACNRRSSAQALAILLGTHHRVGSASPLRTLPAALIRQIIEQTNFGFNAREQNGVCFRGISCEDFDRNIVSGFLLCPLKCAQDDDIAQSSNAPADLQHIAHMIDT